MVTTRNYKIGRRADEFTKEFKPIEVEETEVKTVNTTLSDLKRQRDTMQTRIDEINVIVEAIETLLG